MVCKYPWQTALDQVLQQLHGPGRPRNDGGAPMVSDPEKLMERLREVEVAIFSRQQEMVNSPHERAEREALEDATKKLRELQIQVLGYPDWSTANQ